MDDGAVPDSTLLERIGRGELAAFDALVTRYERPLFRFARRLAGSDAEDVLQDAFLALWKGAASWRAEASVRAWLFQIVANGCHRRGRRIAASPEAAPQLEPVPADVPAPDAVASAREVGHAIEAALAALEPEAREVLMLRDVEGLSGEEVAQVLSLGVPAMKSRLHRARLALKEKVEAALGRPITEELS